MLARVLGVGVSARWVTGHTVYSQYYEFRKILEDHGVFYALVVSMSQRVIARTTVSILAGGRRADKLSVALPTFARRPAPPVRLKT